MRGSKGWNGDARAKAGLTCGDGSQKRCQAVGLTLSLGVASDSVAPNSATPRPVVEHLAGGHFRSALLAQRSEGRSMVPAQRLTHQVALVSAPMKIIGDGL